MLTVIYSRNTLALTAIYYLYLPPAIFLITWLKPYIEIPLACLSAVVPIFIFKGVKGDIIHGCVRKKTIIFETEFLRENVITDSISSNHKSTLIRKIFRTTTPRPHRTTHVSE